jgi:hypothetical protein
MDKPHFTGLARTKRTKYITLLGEGRGFESRLLLQRPWAVGTISVHREKWWHSLARSVFGVIEVEGRLKSLSGPV